MKLQCLPIYKYFLCDSRYIFSLELLCWPQCINVTICVPKYAQIILHTRLCHVFPNSSWTFHTFKNIFTIYSSWPIKMTKKWILEINQGNSNKNKRLPSPLFYQNSTVVYVVMTDKRKNKHLIVTHLFCKYQFTQIIW